LKLNAKKLLDMEDGSTASEKPRIPGQASEKPLSSLSGPLNRDAALGCIPLRNPRVDCQRLDSGCVQLAYPVVMRPFWAALARRLGAGGPVTRQLELDLMGTAVWDLIDCQASVRQIADSFARRFQLDGAEARTSVTAFLRELGRRGIIGMQDRA